MSPTPVPSRHSPLPLAVARRRPNAVQAARTALGALAFLLLVMNAGGWFFLRSVIRGQERLLEQGLESTAALISGALTPANVYILGATFDAESGTTDWSSLPFYASFPSAADLRRAIADASKGSEESTISILSTDGRPLVDELQFHSEPVDVPKFQRELPLIRAAAAGTPTSSTRSAQDLSKRAYHPIRDEDGRAVAVLCVEASPDFGFPLRQQIRRLTMAAVASTILLIIVAVALQRLVRRTVIAERIAEQSDRLRALGTATAGIAHEIRNPLGIITLSIEELQAVSRDVAEVKTRGNLEAILRDLADEAKRLRALTDQFLDFARGEPSPAAAAIDVCEGTTRTLDLYSKGKPDTVTIRRTIPDGPLPVLFSEGRLRQVLLNLLRNSEEALGGAAGEIHVAVTREKRMAVIVVRDNGPGMDPATAAQIFDPFFTTHTGGTGLGLSICRSLVEATGGSLTVQSAKGAGAAFQLALPLRADTQP